MLKVNVHCAVLSLSNGIIGCAGYDTVTQLIEVKSADVKDCRQKLDMAKRR
jgi:hypothetical protein